MKILALILIFFCAVSMYACGIWFTRMNSVMGNEPMYYEKYQLTQSFRQQFDQLVDAAINVNLLYKSVGNVEDGGAVDEKKLLQEFKAYYNILDGTITDSTIIQNDIVYPIKEIPENLQENYQEYKQVVDTRLSNYRKIYIQNQLDDYRSAQQELNSYKNFLYYIEDANGNEIASNSSKSSITSASQHLILQGDFITDKMAVSGYLTQYGNQVAMEFGGKVYAGVPNFILSGDAFYDNMVEFNSVRAMIPVVLIFLFCVVVLISLLSVYIILVAGQDDKGAEVCMREIDRIFTDVHFFVTLLSEILLALGIVVTVKYVVFMNTLNYWGYIAMVFQCACFVLGIFSLLSFFCSMSRHWKVKRIISHTLLAELIRRIGRSLSKSTFKGWIIFLMLSYAAVHLFLGIVLPQTFLLFCSVALFFNIISVVIMSKALDSLSRIMRAAKEISGGNLCVEIDFSKISPTFLDFANDMVKIQDGMKFAVDDAVKNERMRAELITNVSHDLKTPLTSIITYVDLLKKEKITSENASQYIRVLDEKSARLKQLIEDLIEASKASSGKLSVNKGKVDLRQLVLQACGEFDEKIKAAELDFRVSSQEEVLICADGKHMWRILENLISNTIKYSMANSRVYTEIIKMESIGVLIIKNISERAIDINPELLAERFVRGDESRTMEGSGLGLSIAKSLTQLQGGQLEITIDGDLFKVTVKMPLWEKEEELLELDLDAQACIHPPCI